MSLEKLVEDKKFPIFVSLPKNDPELLEAAISGGADGIKVHINAHHRASGTVFGSFEEEKEFLEILGKKNILKSIMIGDQVLPSLEELNELAALGFEYFDLYLHHSKPFIFDSKLKPMLALAHGYTSKDIEKVREVPHCVVEASIVDPNRYGESLTEDDLAHYREIKNETKRPIIVPSQKAIEPSQILDLMEAGVDALLIGVIVTGSSAVEIEKNTQKFVNARNQYRPS